jgi:hypothetical protein
MRAALSAVECAIQNCPGSTDAMIASVASLDTIETITPQMLVAQPQTADLRMSQPDRLNSEEPVLKAINERHHDAS